jgi:hypothetical protein
MLNDRGFSSLDSGALSGNPVDVCIEEGWQGGLHKEAAQLTQPNTSRNAIDRVRLRKPSSLRLYSAIHGEMNDSVAMNCPSETTVVWLAKGVAGNVLTAAGTTLFTALINIWIENRKAVNNAPILQKDFDTIAARLKELEKICCEEWGLGKMLIKRDEEDLKARINALLQRSESIHKWLAAFKEGESISHKTDRCRFLVLSLTIQDIRLADAWWANRGTNVDPGI